MSDGSIKFVLGTPRYCPRCDHWENATDHCFGYNLTEADELTPDEEARLADSDHLRMREDEFHAYRRGERGIPWHQRGWKPKLL